MFRKAAELDPLSPIVIYNYADDLADNGRFDEAFKQADRVIELDPASPLGYGLKGFFYHNELGQVDEALHWWEEAIVRDPGNLSLRMLRGRGVASQGRFDAALAMLDSLATNNPDVAVVASGLALACLILGRPAEAFEWYRRAAVLDPGDNLALIWCNRALLTLDRPDLAESWAKPLGLSGRLTLMHVAVARGDFEFAEAIQREVNEEAGEFGGRFLRDEAAFVDLARGRSESARTRYAEAFPFLLEEDQPVVASARIGPALGLAAALIGTGEPVRARLILEKVEERLDAFTDAQRLLFYCTELMRLYALQGRTADGLDVLRRRLEIGVPRRWYLYEHDPYLAALRDKPEFEAMIKSIREDVARQRAQIPEELLAAP
jgi:tetratricopeptide (TPR) repeat protein